MSLEDVRKQIIALRKQGLTQEAIARRLNYTQGRISQLLPPELRRSRKYGYNPAARVNETVAAMLNAGYSQADCARRFGVTESSMSVRVQRMRADGWDIPPKRTRRDESESAS
jgi:DNA-binding NarL/FixJ family response regulator